MTRRYLLAGLGATAAAATLGARPGCASSPAPAIPRPQDFHANADQLSFLDDTIRRGCAFFWEHGDDETGQVLDRARADGGTETRRMASIAATGFGLSALCIADRYKFYPHAAVLERVRRTLRFLWTSLPQQEGFFWHFSDIKTGVAARGSELSSIDTALLMLGVLTCRSYFEDAEVKDLATKIYERVNWPWMLNGGDSLAMGWFADKGFIHARWNMFAEESFLYLLAIGSPSHPLPASAWDSFRRERTSYAGIDYISAPAPIFVHQYTHAWFDLQGKRDKYADYFDNSVKATEAHRLFCLSLGKPYSPQYWGISASDSEAGYTAWGGPPRQGKIDGSVVPCAAGGSLAFLPAACLETLLSLRQKYGGKAWGRYGFVDAFHPDKGWYDPDVLGIDLGATVLAAENLRSGFVREVFSRDPQMQQAIKLAGFKADDARQAQLR